jgi:hypothetical protein
VSLSLSNVSSATSSFNPLSNNDHVGGVLLTRVGVDLIKGGVSSLTLASDLRGTSGAQKDLLSLALIGWKGLAVASMSS